MAAASSDAVVSEQPLHCIHILESVCCQSRSTHIHAPRKGLTGATGNTDAVSNSMIAVQLRVLYTCMRMATNAGMPGACATSDAHV